MKLGNSRGNLLSGRAPRQADFFPQTVTYLSPQGCMTQNNPALQANARSLCRLKTSSRERCSICWDGDIPSAPTHPCWAITTVDKVLSTPCVWCRFVGSVLWRGSEMLEVSGNHSTSTLKMLQAILERNEQHKNTWEQRHIRSTSLS